LKGGLVQQVFVCEANKLAKEMNKRRWDMIAKEIDLFKGIEFTVMEQITEICIEESFKPGTTLFKRGENAEALYIIEEGTLKLEVEDGSSLTFSLTDPGTLFGWSSLAE
jgi:CRP-like cAMP-binding protein